MTFALTPQEFHGFCSPTGADIRGTSATIPGTAGCAFIAADPANPASIQGDGHTSVDWDGQTDFTIAGVPVFVDDYGQEWLGHHLLPAGADPLRDPVVDLMQLEVSIGRVMELAERVEQLLADMPDAAVACPSATHAAVFLRQRYREAKRAVEIARG